MWSLITLGIRTEQYGPLVSPKVLEKLPDEIRLVISRKLGTNNWYVDHVLEILKHENAARENCDFFWKQILKTNLKNLRKRKITKRRCVTVDALLEGSLKRFLKCQNHCRDKCKVVTDYSHVKI